MGHGVILTFAEDFFQTVDERDRLLRLHAVFVCQDLFVTKVGVVVPCPCVGEGLCLGTVFGADVVVYRVVVAFGIERRIDITKINRLVTDKLPHHIKIIAVVEFIHWDCSGVGNRGKIARKRAFGQLCGWLLVLGLWILVLHRIAMIDCSRG